MIATEADIPLIVELALESHPGSVWAQVGAKPDPESIERTVRALMAREDALVLVCDRGTLWLVKQALWFDHSQPVTFEMFFYATRGGDALRREGEKWADGLILMNRHATTDARLDTYYRRAGYVPIEHAFVRRA